MAGEQEYDEQQVDIVNSIMRYENGEMEDEEMFEFFQTLVDTGMAWQLQGSYGRIAKFLIDEGMIREGN